MAQKKLSNTVAAATELIMPLIEQQGLILWDVRFEKEGSIWILRIIIDKIDGVSIDDCENLSRPFDTLLDEADPIEQAYCLEVSSAGIERELSKDWHFTQSIGKVVNARLIRPKDGVRDFVGTLTDYVDNVITLECADNSSITINQGDTAYVRLYVEF